MQWLGGFPFGPLRARHGAGVEERLVASIEKDGHTLALDSLCASDLVRGHECGHRGQCVYEVANVVERSALVESTDDRNRARQSATSFARRIVLVRWSHEVHLQRKIVELQHDRGSTSSDVAARSGD